MSDPHPEIAPAFGKRECPRDWTRLLPRNVAVKGPDVTIDECPKCHGVFLDKNELARLTGDLRLNKYLRDRAGLDSDSTLICPHCGGIMDKEAVAGVDVEVCLTCFGLWLDRDELDALKARPNEADITMTAEKHEELARADRARKAGRPGYLPRKEPEPATKTGKARRKVAKAIRAPLGGLDRALDEFVRRYL